MPHVTVTYRGKGHPGNKRAQKVAAYKETVRKAAMLVHVKLPVPTKDHPVTIYTQIFFRNGRHGDTESCHKVIKDSLWPKLRKKVKGQPDLGDDKWVGGAYSLPLYDAKNPRVVVTIEYDI